MIHEHEWFGEEPVQPAGWITQSDKLTCLEQECRVAFCFVCAFEYVYVFVNIIMSVRRQRETCVVVLVYKETHQHN